MARPVPGATHPWIHHYRRLGYGKPGWTGSSLVFTGTLQRFWRCKASQQVKSLALDAGKVEALPGFGKKTAENLRPAIDWFERRPKRFPLADADQVV